jgi:predicted NAD-dependent protein-ADP-ribosyltransferase YbiA (DUF1768 family)
MLQIIGQLCYYQVVKQGKSGGTCEVLARELSEKVEVHWNSVKKKCARRERRGQQRAKTNTGLVRK